MRSIALSLCFILSAAFVAKAQGHATYPQLAVSSVDKAWAQFELEAQVLNNDKVLPHETKELRKKIVALREVLDLFAYSYSYSGKKDPWMSIRDNLDHAYELIGSFKDLYDIQGLEDPSKAEYKNKELKPLRAEVLAWWQEWNQSSASIYEYLANPSLNEIFERSKSDLSKFYWGVSELVPSLDYDGEQNLAFLSTDLLQSALNSWPEVRKIKTPTESLKLENKFHDFRKRVRSVARILRSYPAIYQGSEESLVALESLATRYGEINDMLLVYHKAIDDKKDKKADSLKKDIKQAWKALAEEQDGYVVNLLEETVNAISTQN